MARVVVCGKRGCERAALVTFRIATAAAPQFMAFCYEHIETACEVLVEIKKVAQPVAPDEEQAEIPGRSGRRLADVAASVEGGGRLAVLYDPLTADARLEAAALKREKWLASGRRW